MITAEPMVDTHSLLLVLYVSTLQMKLPNFLQISNPRQRLAIKTMQKVDTQMNKVVHRLHLWILTTNQLKVSSMQQVLNLPSHPSPNCIPTQLNRLANPCAKATIIMTDLNLIPTIMKDVLLEMTRILKLMPPLIITTLLLLVTLLCPRLSPPSLDKNATKLK